MEWKERKCGEWDEGNKIFLFENQMVQHSHEPHYSHEWKDYLNYSKIHWWKEKENY